MAMGFGKESFPVDCRMSQKDGIGKSVFHSSACIAYVYQHNFPYTLLNVWAYNNIRHLSCYDSAVNVKSV